MEKEYKKMRSSSLIRVQKELLGKKISKFHQFAGVKRKVESFKMKGKIKRISGEGKPRDFIAKRHTIRTIKA